MSAGYRRRAVSRSCGQVATEQVGHLSGRLGIVAAVSSAMVSAWMTAGQPVGNLRVDLANRFGRFASSHTLLQHCHLYCSARNGV